MSHQLKHETGLLEYGDFLVGSVVVEGKAYVFTSHGMFFYVDKKRQGHHDSTPELELVRCELEIRPSEG